MGCRISFIFVSKCESFEIVGTSGPARVSGVLNQFLGPMPGKVYSLQFQQGEMVEITADGSSLIAPQAIVAFIGQATGGDATHLDDTNRNWPEGFFQFNSGGTVPNLVILSGSGAGKYSPITDNTSQQLTFTANPGMVPDNSSEYAIVWDISRQPAGGQILPLVFTAPETGAYTIEITTTLSIGSAPADPYGRGIYFLQKSELSGGAVPQGGHFASTYDSVRDVFWTIDNPSMKTPFVSNSGGSWLCKISAAGLLLSRTSIAGASYGNITYCPVNDRLALVTNDTGDLVIVNPASMTIESTTGIGAAPAGAYPLCAFCPSNNLLYCPSGVVINPVAKTLVTTVVGIPPNDYVPTFIPADGKLWYAPAFYYSSGLGIIKVVDPGTNTISNTIDIPIPNLSQMSQFAFVPSTGFVYAGGTRYPATLSVFDPSTYTLIRQTALDQVTNITGIVYRQQDRLLYAGTESNSGEMGTLCVIDPSSEEIIDRKLCGPQVYIINQSLSGVLGLSSYFFNWNFPTAWNMQRSLGTHNP